MLNTTALSATAPHLSVLDDPDSFPGCEEGQEGKGHARPVREVHETANLWERRESVGRQSSKIIPHPGGWAVGGKVLDVQNMEQPDNF